MKIESDKKYDTFRVRLRVCVRFARHLRVSTSSNVRLTSCDHKFCGADGYRGELGVRTQPRPELGYLWHFPDLWRESSVTVPVSRKLWLRAGVVVKTSPDPPSLDLLDKIPNYSVGPMPIQAHRRGYGFQGRSIGLNLDGMFWNKTGWVEIYFVFFLKIIIVTSLPREVRTTAILRVCMFVCLSACISQNRMSKLHEIFFCTCYWWPWLVLWRTTSTTYKF